MRAAIIYQEIDISTVIKIVLDREVENDLNKNQWKRK